jgi:hypothetical protein
VVQGLQSDLGAFDAGTYRTATDATARQLASQDPPDLTDRAAALAKMGALAKDVGELQSALDAMRQEIQDLRASIAELKDRLGKPQPPPPGANGGAGICARPAPHEFALTGSYTGYPLKLEVLAPHGEVMFTFTFPRPGATATGEHPAICPNTLILRNARGEEIARKPGWVLPREAGYHVDLPL